MSVYSIDRLMQEARRLAVEYRRSTGKTLPVSGELAVYDAIRLLGLEPAPEGSRGFDAIRRHGAGFDRLQVKARVIFDDTRRGHRIGQLQAGAEWDGVLLVLMDEAYEPSEILQADRAAVLEALEASADSRRANRGAMSVARFRIIGRRVWARESGREDDAGAGLGPR
ncbi:MAG: hypothetical protein AB7Q97_03260 [Gammaproteobacteria bacterium]